MVKIPRLRSSWRPARTVVVYGLGVLGALVIMLWRLASSPSQPIPGELQAKAASRLTSIADKVLFAPWKIVEDGLVHIAHQSMFLPRLTSVIFGLVCLAALFYCVKVWLGPIIAAFTTALLLSTPLFLLSSRQATPYILYFWPVVTVAAYLYFRRSANWLAMLALVLAIAIGLYIPGIIWLLVIALALRWQPTLQAVKNISNRRLAIIAVGIIILISPLVINLVIHPGLLKDYFLIPHQFSGVTSELKNWLWAGSALAFKARHHQEILLGQTAILDITMVGLALFGGFVLFSKLRRSFYLVVASLLAVSLLAGWSGQYMALALIVTPLIVVMGFGFRFLFLEWLHTFPRNPLPRYYAYGIMAAVVLIHIIYGIRYALIAWPIA